MSAAVRKVVGLVHRLKGGECPRVHGPRKTFADIRPPPLRSAPRKTWAALNTSSPTSCSAAASASSACRCSLSTVSPPHSHAKADVSVPEDTVDPYEYRARDDLQASERATISALWLLCLSFFLDLTREGLAALRPPSRGVFPSQLTMLSWTVAVLTR